MTHLTWILFDLTNDFLEKKLLKCYGEGVKDLGSAIQRSLKSRDEAQYVSPLSIFFLLHKINIVKSEFLTKTRINLASTSPRCRYKRAVAVSVDVCLAFVLALVLVLVLTLLALLSSPCSFFSYSSYLCTYHCPLYSSFEFLFQ